MKRATLRKIDKYCYEPTAKMRKKMTQRQSNYYLYEDGKEIYAVYERALKQITKDRYNLIGVYNKKVQLEELREDILWYIESIMEARP